MEKYLKYERLVHPIRFLNLLPLSHVFGQFLGIFLPPLLGGTVVFENTFNPTEVMATIRRERVSVLVAVPRMIESLKQKIERDLDEDFAGLCGGGLRRQTGQSPVATRISPRASPQPKASTFCDAGGHSATCAASSDGSSGP